MNFLGTLRVEQQAALNVLLPERYGILAATTGFGKTIIAAKLIAERNTNTLILVHRQQLLEQWTERLSSLLGLSPQSIGMIGGGHCKITGVIDIAMLQSLSKKGVVCNEVTQYGQVIVDECHHISAFSFEQVLKHVKAHYVLGLTATPTRKDGHHPIIVMQCGPIRYRVSSKSQIMASQLQHRVQVRKTSFALSDNNIPKMSELYGALVTNEARNTLILNDVLSTLNEGRIPLLLTERIQHLEWFANKLSPLVEHLFILRGGMKKLDRKNVLQAIMDLPNEATRLILATGSYIGEGFDDPKLDTLFITLPISWQGTLQQYVGRLHRVHDQKKDIMVYDYVDFNVPMLEKMYQKRLKKYCAMGYNVETAV